MSSPIGIHRPRATGWHAAFSTASSPSPAASSSIPMPPPPPPSPCESSLDITPRKTSFSMASSRSVACAFPSWPKRSSLYSDSEESASSYLSDEDLFFESPVSSSPTSSLSSAAAAVDDDDVSPFSSVCGAELTTEEQIRLMHSDHAQEEREREQRHFAQMHAQARAQQARRAAMQLQQQQQQQTTTSTSSKRRKRRVAGADKKRTSSSSSRGRAVS